MYQVIMWRIQKWLGGGTLWLIESVGSLYIISVNYVPTGGSSYIELPEELQNSKKGLINIKNLKDKESFQWFLIRHLNPMHKNLS